ncbi:MAG: hypothetical protein K0R28_2661 [Paenibacillus sp.]|jgi:hypothetical protein|nr:hypothetical protein [Paenibacillus sp.]
MGEVIRRYERYETTGNRTILFVTNDDDECSAAVFQMALLPALNHFGIPYQVKDRRELGVSSNVAEAAAVVLAHDGVAAALTEEQWALIAAASNNGAGVVSFDGQLWRAKPDIQRFFGGSSMTASEINEIRIPDNAHYIAQMQTSGQVHRMIKPVAASLPDGIVDGAVSIAHDRSGRMLASAIPERAGGAAGGGRRAALYFSPVLWTRQHFGHAAGLDDLLWRCLVWVARKPFATLMMPPFAVCRVDDAVGSYDRFDYVKVLNEYNWVPNIGLFVDEIDNECAAEIKYCHDNKMAEFSAHSFHELGEPQPDQIYIRHDGSEYTFEQMKEHFERLDRFYGSIGVTPSRTVNIHYDELGLNSLPFLLNRKQTYMMALIPPGVHWYANSYSWEPYPYGHQGFNYGPMEPDQRFWNAVAHHLGGYKTPDTGMGPGEFLGGCTTFNNESAATDIRKAIRRGADAVKLGISSGFFGTLMTHEQRIAALGPEEWRAIIEGIHGELDEWHILYRTYDQVSDYCKDKARTRIMEAHYDPATSRLTVGLEGTAEHGMYYNIYRVEEGGNVSCEIVHTAPFAGRLLCAATEERM